MNRHDGKLLELFEEHLAVVTGGHRSVFSEDQISDDLGLDSLQAAEIVVGIEMETGTTLLGDPRLVECVTVGDVIELVETLQADAGTGVRS